MTQIWQFINKLELIMTIIFLGWVTGSQIIALYRVATGRKSSGFGFEGNKITYFVWEILCLKCLYYL